MDFLGIFLDSASCSDSPRSNKRSLKFPGTYDILVSMTRNAKSSPPKLTKRRRSPKSGQWLLQDAKARFSELVRRVRSEGPQRVTVHGRDEVVVISAEEFRRLKGDLTGESLIAAMQASPHRDIDIKPGRAPMPVREVRF
jgi:prevent-host-death family protein